MGIFNTNSTHGKVYGSHKKTTEFLGAKSSGEDYYTKPKKGKGSMEKGLC